MAKITKCDQNVKKQKKKNLECKKDVKKRNGQRLRPRASRPLR